MKTSAPAAGSQAREERRGNAVCHTVASEAGGRESAIASDSTQVTGRGVGETPSVSLC